MKKFISDVFFGFVILCYVIGERVYKTVRDIFKVLKNAFRPL